jgi:hypothetical protein
LAGCKHLGIATNIHPKCIHIKLLLNIHLRVYDNGMPGKCELIPVWRGFFLVYQFPPCIGIVNFREVDNVAFVAFNVQKFCLQIKGYDNAAIFLRSNKPDMGGLNRKPEKGCICGGMKGVVFVKAQLAIKGNQPQPSVQVFTEHEYFIVWQAVEGREYIELNTVVPGNPLVGAKPEDALAVAVNLVNGIARKAILVGKVKHREILAEYFAGDEEHCNK